MKHSIVHVYTWVFVSSIVAGGCTASTSIPTNVNLSNITNSTTSISALPSGARAVKIIFQSATGGSFNTPGSGGTVNSPGLGHPAVRVFNSDGSLLGSTSTSGVRTNWPTWLSSFEVGISGSLNKAALNSRCATFSDSTETNSTNCLLASVASDCRAPSAPSGLFRVSEADCSIGTSPASAGTGGPSDGVYLRAVFDRASLGAYENILVTLEFSVSALNPAPANPTACFSGGKFTPELCSDFVWKAYLKHSSSEVLLPYLMLVPPTFSWVIGNASSGAGISAKQFVVPLGADPTLSVLQISRTQSNFPSATNLTSYCANGGLPANSPLCAGMVFYSITFYRM